MLPDRTPNTAAEHPDTEHRTAGPNTHPDGAVDPRRARTVRRLRTARTIALTVVVILPPTINAQNIVEWAASPDGLGLDTVRPYGLWPWVAFGGLDLIAAVCVFETLIQTSFGRKAGAFAALVWLFAGASAYAGFRHGTQPGVGRDVKWFFPLMAVSGPLLLHLILTRTRKDVQVEEGKRLQHCPASAYGLARWIPGVGAFVETYCAWRIGRLEGITRPDESIARYRYLRLTTGRTVRVLQAMRDDAARTPTVRAPSADTTATPSTEHAPAAPARTPGQPRSNTPARTVTRRTKPGVRSNTGLSDTELFAKVDNAYPNWRTDMPSVRKIALLFGVATSTGHTYQQRLIAEQAKPEERSA
jgi:hypothetical protein